MSDHDKCDCSLCLAIESESSIYEDKKIKILETKNLKGHKRRIMVIYREHNALPSPDMQRKMLNQLENIGREAFSYAFKFIIMSQKFATIRDHWHYVASDLNPESTDFYQVLGTPWERVVHVKDWIKDEVIDARAAILMA